MTKEKLTQEKLLDLLAELRRRDLGPPAETKTFPHPDGLTFSRAWELAQDPSSMTEAERSHLEGCRRCAHLVQSARHELPEKSQPAKRRKRLGDFLRERSGVLLPEKERSESFQNVTVLDGWDSAAVKQMTPEGWDKRIEDFGYYVGLFLVSLLSRALCIGVTWGQTVEEAISGVLRFCRRFRRVRRRSPVKCVPTVGGPVADPHGPPRSSSTRQAHRLAYALNGEQGHAYTLQGVEAFISFTDDSAYITETRERYHRFTNYQAIFGGGGNAGVVDRLDALVTSCGNAQQPSKFWTAELGRQGITAKTLDRLTYGDIGGVLLPRPELSRDDQVLLDEFALRWTGITLDHYRRCAQREPGVILVALGRNKADVVMKCIEFDLVTELLIDEDLGTALWDLVDPGYEHHPRLEPTVGTPLPVGQKS